MGVTISWAHFLVEEFRVDFLEAQEKKSPFHYSWMLILIALIGWGEPVDSSFIPPIPGRCEATRYASLWHSSIKERQKDTNVCFVVYHMNIEVSLRSLPRISDEVVAKYGHITTFQATMHHIYLHARLDPSWTWLPLPYRVGDPATDKEILEWQEDWRPYVVGSSIVYPNNKRKDKKTGGTTPSQGALSGKRSTQGNRGPGKRKGKKRCGGSCDQKRSKRQCTHNS